MNISACICFKCNEQNDNLPYSPALDRQEGRPQVRAERDDLDTQEVVKACGFNDILGGGLKKSIFKTKTITWGNNPI